MGSQKHDTSLNLKPLVSGEMDPNLPSIVNLFAIYLRSTCNQAYDQKTGG